MSRYIDADFEIAHYTSMTTNPTPDVTEKDKRNSLIILDALRMAKTVEIIHCKECKYKRINEDGETRYHYCALEDRPNRQWSVDDTDYCSWGEVRDE